MPTEIESNGGILRPFQPGQSGNPGGKTSEQKRREMRNAEMATRLQEFLLEREIAAIETPADIEATILVRETLKDVLSPAQLAVVLSTLNVALTNERLKLIKDAQDRGLGAPKQTLGGDPESPIKHEHEASAELAAMLDAISARKP